MWDPLHLPVEKSLLSTWTTPTLCTVQTYTARHLPMSCFHPQPREARSSQWVVLLVHAPSTCCSKPSEDKDGVRLKPALGPSSV